MKLSKYLDRIGFSGNASPTVASLTELMRAHTLGVPFENLDVQLGRALTTSVDTAYSKIVETGRGGWCYEQNGLFGWALTQIGFAVTRLSAAVRLEERGDIALNNHLTLLVQCDDGATDYLVDVGFGGSQLGPIPLQECAVSHPPFELSLIKLGSRWRLVEAYATSRLSYDFSAEQADEAALAAKCEWLQTSPESSFVLSLVAQRRLADAHRVLRGRVFTERRLDGETSRLIGSPDELVSVLRNAFGLNVPEVRSLWQRIEARHAEFFDH
ncbi:MAG: arylamine N-acetyltransferase [Pseudomonadota bacterium]